LTTKKEAEAYQRYERSEKRPEQKTGREDCPLTIMRGRREKTGECSYLATPKSQTGVYHGKTRQIGKRRRRPIHGELLQKVI